MNTEHESAPTSVSRPLGAWSTAALVVGHTIGIGIFLTPAELIGALASPAWTLGLWVACGALVLAGALTFGELAARRPQQGGTYVYLREAWGPRVAFLYGWQSLLIMDPGVTAALALGLSQYLVVLWPAAAGRERWAALLAVWALAAVGMTGLRPSSRLLNALTALKVAALVAIVIGAAAVGAGSLAHFSPFFARRAGAPPLAEALGLGLIGAFYSFGGFWEASRVAGEVRDPGRHLPRAFTLGVAVVTLLYIATTVAFLYLVPPERSREPRVFAESAGRALLGPSGAPAFAAVVTLSVAASALALILMAPRVYLAMGRDGLFPAPLAALDPKTRSPRRATALLAALASVYVLSGSFPEVVAFFMCTTLVFVSLAAAGLFVLRRGDTRAPAFLAPGFPATPALFLSLTIAVVVLIALARPIPALAGFVLVLAGLPFYRAAAPRPGRAVRLEGEMS